MKKDNKKALYESIMMAVAKEVKKALNEDEIKNIDEIFSDVDESCKEPFATAELSNDRSYLLAENEAASAME